MEVKGVDADDIVARYAAGATITAIAAEVGSYPPKIWRVLVERGVAIRRSKRRIPADVAGLVADYESRTPVGEIARRLGVSPHTVRSRLADAGALHLIRRPDIDAAEIARRRKGGQPIRLIAAEVGLSPMTLRRRIAAARQPGDAAHGGGNISPLRRAWYGRLPADPPERVSARDWDIFRRVVAGETQRTIARELGISPARIGQILPAVDRRLRECADS